MFTKTRRAFTLIEIMIVVLIIGILLAIAVPNFVRARESSRQKACVGNLKQIKSAVEQWAMDNRKAADGSTTGAVLVGSDAYLNATPVCPAGGSYTNPATVAADPSCNYAPTPNTFPHNINALQNP